ncbi:hypothetical protein N7495_002738 [Penicillium taxi]|uniref:uncharacterized protein n=1 Tax=Penicillium taxi TaxID=168475 RepID=UPI00254574FE|nr:uncharacterized protein N7495_002738 [Penicillium taxi]KAJ5902210.1 hypothetical protein N7495_002738 [Penicillium taxi]
MAKISKCLDRVIKFLTQNQGSPAAEILAMIHIQISRIRIKGQKDRIADRADKKAEAKHGMSWILLLKAAIVGFVLGYNANISIKGFHIHSEVHGYETFNFDRYMGNLEPLGLER